MRFAALVMLLLVSALAGPAAAAPVTQTCTDSATVRWEVGLGHTVVDAAHVEVLGCPDGQEVGIQLITDGGDIPAEPLVGTLQAQRARFDLTDYDVGVVPLTGVRVWLYGPDGEELLKVTIDERFFNRAGNEQVGLRELTVLRVAPGDDYVVTDVPQRYEEVTCADVGVATGSDVVGAGTGTFVASTSGRHIVCYQQVTGQGQSPDEQGPDVLGEVLTRDGASAEGGNDADGGTLPLSGASVLGAAGSAVALLALGSIVLRRREAGDQPSA